MGVRHISAYLLRTFCVYATWYSSDDSDSMLTALLSAGSVGKPSFVNSGVGSHIDLQWDPFSRPQSLG